ncbi:MAG: phosphotransferase, partial [Candidatus Zixiibacteriota bacterium]
MTSSVKLTRLGRMRRLRQLAQKALDAYGLSAPGLTFLACEGNAIYRVDTSKPIAAVRKNNLHHPNRYVLRVHMDYHSTEAIRSELLWLSALRQELDFPAPEPVPTVSGDLVTEVSLPGDNHMRRKCSMLRWVKGRFLHRRLTTGKIRAWGRLTGRLHEHSAAWKPPRGFVRPHRNWKGLFSDAAGFEFPAAELWEAVPKDFKEAFDTVTRRVKQVMGRLGTGPDVYGLVHADLDVNTNILFNR